MCVFPRGGRQSPALKTIENNSKQWPLSETLQSIYSVKVKAFHHGRHDNHRNGDHQKHKGKQIDGWRDDFPPCNNRTSWAQDLLYDLNQLVELYGDVEGQAGYGGSW